MPRPIYAFYYTESTPHAIIIESSKVKAQKLEIEAPAGVHMEKFRHLTKHQVSCLTYVEAISFEKRIEEKQ